MSFASVLVGASECVISISFSIDCDQSGKKYNLLYKGFVEMRKYNTKQPRLPAIKSLILSFKGMGRYGIIRMEKYQAGALSYQ